MPIDQELTGTAKPVRQKKAQMTDLLVSKAKEREKPYKMADSGGLYLYIATSGHKSWRMKYRFAGKERRLTFGSYPNVKLSEARKKREAARLCLQNHQDPSVVAKAVRLKAESDHGTTFADVAREWHALQTPKWKAHHADDVLTSLQVNIFPYLGSMPITAIDEKMVLVVLRKVEARGAIETAHRLLQRINAVFNFSKGCGNGNGNPASDLKGSLVAVPPKRKRPAIVVLSDLRLLTAKIDSATAHPITKLASRFVALSVQRIGTVRTMPWSEIEGVNWDDEITPCPDAIWHIPAARMKLELDLRADDEFDHLVPLSGAAVDVLRAARRISGRGPLVFPGTRSLHDPISENAVGYLYNRAGYKGVHVPHGWRSAFSTIMNGRAERASFGSDRLIIDRLIVDLMLAHLPTGISGNELDYNRQAYPERRREISDTWAHLLMDGQMSATDVLLGPRRRASAVASG